MNCKDFEDGLATLAEGGKAPEAARHAADCAVCAVRLGQMRHVVAAARRLREHAPSELVSRASALMRPTPRLVARLLGNGLKASGARRGEAKDFALHVGVDGFSVRLQYAPVPGGWEVMGRAPTPDWTIAHEGGVVPCGSSGRFRLVVSGLEGTSFVLRKDGTEIEVPSARELIDLDA